MRFVEKVSDLRMEKKKAILSGVELVICFKVGPLWSHTLTLEILPLFEARLKCFIQNCFQLCHCILHDVLSALKAGAFQWHLHF